MVQPRHHIGAADANERHHAEVGPLYVGMPAVALAVDGAVVLLLAAVEPVLAPRGQRETLRRVEPALGDLVEGLSEDAIGVLVGVDGVEPRSRTGQARAPPPVARRDDRSGASGSSGA